MIFANASTYEKPWFVCSQRIVQQLAIAQPTCSVQAKERPRLTAQQSEQLKLQNCGVWRPVVNALSDEAIMKKRIFIAPFPIAVFQRSSHVRSLFHTLTSRCQAPRRHSGNLSQLSNWHFQVGVSGMLSVSPTSSQRFEMGLLRNLIFVRCSRESCSRNLAVEKAVCELPAECQFCSQQLPRSELHHHETNLCDERYFESFEAIFRNPWRSLSTAAIAAQQL